LAIAAFLSIVLSITRLALATIAAMNVVLLSLFAAAGATELTLANWDTQTAGKSVFIKFQAPW